MGELRTDFLGLSHLDLLSSGSGCRSCYGTELGRLRWRRVWEVTKVARELNHHLLLVYVRSIRPVDLTYRLA